MLSKFAAPTILAAALVTLAPAEEKTVYKSDFDRGVSRKNWSDTRTKEARNGDRFLLGRFREESSTTLSIGDLPEHSLVRLKFKLHILDSADGSYPDNPDAWSVGVVGGACLLLTSFQNGWSVENQKDLLPFSRFPQAFPDEYPAGLHNYRTGAVEKNTLGLQDPILRTPISYDTGYQLDMVFPHRGKDLALRFGGIFLGKDDESWALDDVEVSLVDPQKTTEEELMKLWVTLLEDDPVEANAALWKILAAGKTGMDFAVGRIGKLAEEGADLALAREKKDAKEFAAAMEQLKSEKFAERIKATQAITGMGVRVKPLVEKALIEDDDLEIQRLLKSILIKFAKRAAPAEEEKDASVARSRIKHLLRVIDTDASRAAIAKLVAEDQLVGAKPELMQQTAERGQRLGFRWPLKYDADRGCLTQWRCIENRARWIFRGVAAGEYEVAVDILPIDEVGDQFEVIVAGQVLVGTVPERKGKEGEFQRLSLGKISIDNAGTYALYVRPILVKGIHMMDLKSIELKPVEAE